MSVEEQLRRWMGDVSEIPTSIPWGPREATFEQIMIAWALIWQKQHGDEIGNPVTLGYVLAGFVVSSPATRAYGWQQRVERVLVSRPSTPEDA
jgi:hypothetical protein